METEEQPSPPGSETPEELIEKFEKRRLWRKSTAGQVARAVREAERRTAEEERERKEGEETEPDIVEKTKTSIVGWPVETVRKIWRRKKTS